MAKSNVFGWHEQLSVGNKGERFFLKNYPDASKSDGKIDDFKLSNGETVELKTDTYSMEKTPNFFMEYIGNMKKGNLGGPWRAAKDNIDWFVYLFLYDQKFFWFNTKELVGFLDEHIKTLKVKTVRNPGYDSTGFAVNRDEVAHLMKKPPSTSEKS